MNTNDGTFKYKAQICKVKCLRVTFAKGVNIPTHREITFSHNVLKQEHRERLPIENHACGRIVKTINFPNTFS